MMTGPPENIPPLDWLTWRIERMACANAGQPSPPMPGRPVSAVPQGGEEPQPSDAIRHITQLIEEAQQREAQQG